MARRRGRGEGSIHQRDDGLWCGRISLGVDQSGKRLRKYVYARTKSALLEKMRTMDRSAPTVTPSTMTLGSYLVGYAERREHEVAPETYRREKSLLRNHVVPHIGGLKLKKLEPIHIAQWFTTMRKAGASPSTQRKAAVALSTALKAAVSLKLIRHNCVTDVPKPRDERREIEVLDANQAKKLMDESSCEWIHPIIVLALTSGARQGELFALGWNDVDFDKATIGITKSLEESNGKLRIKDTKTRGSRRTITIPTTTVDCLAEHRENMLASGTYQPEVMFPTLRGTRIRKSNLHRRHWKPLLVKLQLPDVTFHSLRHTHATLLLQAGESVKTVQHRLGHSSAQVTLDVYAHVLKDAQSSAADTMQQLFG